MDVQLGSTRASDFDYLARNPQEGRVKSSLMKSKDTREINEAAQDFEALLLANLLQKMQESATAFGDNENSDSATETFRDFGAQQLALQIATHGGIGIARLISNALKGNVQDK